MPSLTPRQNLASLFLRLFIAVDLAVLLVIFLHSQFQVSFPFPAPGTKLNNPLAALLAALFLLGVANPPFRRRWMDRLQEWVTQVPLRYYLFGFLVALQAGLQIMWFRYPENFHWNLNAEQGYGTHFSTLQLFILGLVVLITAGKDTEAASASHRRWAWYLVASLYFYLALDDCVAIHENFIKWFSNFAPGVSLFHSIHEWLWFYAPFILAIVAYLVWFFIQRFRNKPVLIFIMFLGLVLWVSVILLEGLAKNVVDPKGLEYGRLLISFEEGAEMAGATLFLFGFSEYLRKIPSRPAPAASPDTRT